MGPRDCSGRGAWALHTSAIALATTTIRTSVIATRGVGGRLSSSINTEAACRFSSRNEGRE